MSMQLDFIHLMTYGKKIIRWPVTETNCFGEEKKNGNMAYSKARR